MPVIRRDCSYQISAISGFYLFFKDGHNQKLSWRQFAIWTKACFSLWSNKKGLSWLIWKLKFFGLAYECCKILRKKNQWLQRLGLKERAGGGFHLASDLDGGGLSKEKLELFWLKSCVVSKAEMVQCNLMIFTWSNLTGAKYSLHFWGEKRS